MVEAVSLPSSFDLTVVNISGAPGMDEKHIMMTAEKMVTIMTWRKEHNIRGSTMGFFSHPLKMSRFRKYS